MTSDAVPLDRIRALIERLSPEPICDDCIADKLDLAQTHGTIPRSGELAGIAGFEREKAACAICGEVRSVIRRH